MREPLKEDIANELDLLSTRLPQELYQNLLQRIQWVIDEEIKKKYPMSDEIIISIHAPMKGATAKTKKIYLF